MHGWCLKAQTVPTWVSSTLLFPGSATLPATAAGHTAPSSFSAYFRASEQLPLSPVDALLSCTGSQMKVCEHVCKALTNTQRTGKTQAMRKRSSDPRGQPSRCSRCSWEMIRRQSHVGRGQEPERAISLSLQTATGRRVTRG